MKSRRAISWVWVAYRGGSTPHTSYQHGVGSQTRIEQAEELVEHRDGFYVRVLRPGQAWLVEDRDSMGSIWLGWLGRTTR